MQTPARHMPPDARKNSRAACAARLRALTKPANAKTASEKKREEAIFAYGVSVTCKRRSLTFK